MVEDQRFTQHRPDVLTYETEPLTEDRDRCRRSMTAHLFAATVGHRLRLDRPADRRLSGGLSPTSRRWAAIKLLISGEPVRARFRKSFEKPEPVAPDQVEEYTIDLHWSHHCFRKGHKIMVQVSSTWFPLIDRNPQKFVPNIFEAKDADFTTARQQVFRSAEHPSHLVLETLPARPKSGQRPGR